MDLMKKKPTKNQLPCEIVILILNELRKDYALLNSTMLVNKNFCIISIEILYKNVLNFNYKIPKKLKSKFDYSLVNTIINCLPFSSKMLLKSLNIIKFKKLMFNYISYCKTINLIKTMRLINRVINNNDSYFQIRNYLLENEVVKMILNNSKLSKLKIEGKIEFNKYNKVFYTNTKNITYFSIFFDIHVGEISEIVIKLIHCQDNLSTLKLHVFKNSWEEILPRLDKIQTLKVLIIEGVIPLSFKFIDNYPNLIELVIESSVVDSRSECLYLDKIHTYNLKKLKIRDINYNNNEKFEEKFELFLLNNGFRLEYLDTHTYIDGIYKYCKSIKYLKLRLRNFYCFDLLRKILINCTVLNEIEITPYFNERYLLDIENILHLLSEYAQHNFSCIKFNIKLHNFNLDYDLLLAKLNFFDLPFKVIIIK